MRKFVFSLETLLRHRQYLEERERERLAWIHYRLENEHRFLQDLRGRHAGVREELARQRLPDYDPPEVGWYCAYLNRLDHEMEQADGRIQSLRRELEQQMALWVERSRDKKVLENLRGRREHEHLTAAEKLEQKAVDEMVVTRFAGRK